MRVAILARKSTDKQATSIDRQVEDSHRFAASRGWTVIESCIFFVPEGVSGAVLDRPELRGLLDAGKKRLIDGVVLQISDRLSRLMMETVSIVVGLRDAGIRVFSYTTGEEYKADSPTDRFMLAAKGYIAETERENIVARTSQAAFYRARLGCVAGNRLYGYDNVPVDIGGRAFKMRRPNEQEARWVRWMHERYDEGWGLRRLAAELNTLGVPSPRRGRAGAQEWRHTAIREMLLNESYGGTLVFGGRRRVVRGGKKVVEETPDRVERIDAPHLRIVDPALFARNQARFAASAQGARKVGNTPSALLVGNLLCSVCGSRMYVTGGRDKVYTCGRRHQAGASTCQNGTKRPTDAIDMAVVEALLRVLDHPRLVEEVLSAYTSQVKAEDAADDVTALRTLRGTLNTELTNLTVAVSAATSPAVITRLVAVLEQKEAELAKVDARLAAWRPPSRPTLDRDALRARAAEKVVRLGEVLRKDIPAGREALREVLAGPAQAVPILVNGQRRFLVRARLSAEAVLAQVPTIKTGGEPNGKTS